MLCKVYMRLCAIAIGINIGLICYSLFHQRLELLPLAIVNLLLLSGAFFIKQPKER
jgi:hypothetical protein